MVSNPVTWKDINFKHEFERTAPELVREQYPATARLMIHTICFGAIITLHMYKCSASTVGIINTEKPFSSACWLSS